MKIILRKDDLPGICFECNVPLTRSPRPDPNDPRLPDPNNPRLEPDSHYWNEEKYISFCGASHSSYNHERDRNVKT